VVIPAFNEAQRLPPFLEKVVAYFEGRDEPYEVIVVDDGSTDGTAELVEARRHPTVTVLRLQPNAGKGAAVRAGMLAARGAYRVFADADGATPIEELKRLEPLLVAGADVVIGSRVLVDPGVSVATRPHRVAAGRLFNWMVARMGLRGIADSQCGFKAFTAEVADRVFPELQTRGFGFDVEVLYRAEQAGYKIVEVPTRWINSPQSRVHPIRDSTMMFLELLAIPGRVRKHPTPGLKDDQRRESA